MLFFIQAITLCNSHPSTFYLPFHTSACADQCPIHAPSILSLFVQSAPVLWAWIRAPATHILGARILTTLTLSTPPAAFSALPQHLPSPFFVIVLSSQYLFQRGPIWMFQTAPHIHRALSFSQPGYKVKYHYSPPQFSVDWG